MTRLKLLILLLALSSVTHASAQMPEKQLRRPWAEQRDTVTNYRPQVFGAIKAKFETSLYDGGHRFNIRNSRVGVRGFASPRIEYQVQIDFHDEGDLSVLDAFVSYSHKNFEVTLGQQQYKFSSDLDRGPSNNIFSNRSFIAKYLTTYYGDETGAGQDMVGAIGSRDIGIRAAYSFDKVPFKLSAGIFNGTGSNNPEWNDRVNFVTRLDFGRELGFGAAVAYYQGYTPLKHVWESEEARNQKISMWGGELRYAGRDYRIEGEFAQRRLKDDTNGSATLTAAHVLGYYQFRMAKSSFLEYIAPVARWDMGNDVEFLNKSSFVEAFSANRATIGINLGFLGDIVGSEFRVQFEKYFLDGKPSDYRTNRLLQDKITLEFVATF